MESLTIHLRSVLVIFAVHATTSSASHSVSIKPILPIPHLRDLLFAMLIFLIAIGSRRIVYVIPILGYLDVLFVFLPLLASTPLTLLGAVEAVHVLIAIGCPVGKGILWRRLCDSSRGIRRSCCGLICTQRLMDGLLHRRLGFWFLRS